MKKIGVRILRGDKWQIEEELVLKKRKVYIPKNKELKIEIIQLYHNIPTAINRERWKLMKLMIGKYQWLEIRKNVGSYVNRYNIYQKMKNCIKALVGKLIANKMPEKLWMYSTVDFIIKLLLVVEKDIILLIYNKLSKMVYFIVIIEETLVKGLARLFRDNM